MSEDTALAVPSKAPMSVGSRGIQISTIEELWRFSQAVAKSPFAPRGMSTPEAVMVAIQYGLEVGLTPMAALQNISVVNGKPSLYGDAMLAVVFNSGLMEGVPFEDFEGTPYEDDFVAVCITKRKGSQEAKTTYFSVADAKLAKLWGKEGPWTAYPKRMLMFRARGFNLRDNFPDALKGFISREEAEDYPVDVSSPAMRYPSTTRHPSSDQVSSLVELARSCGVDLVTFGHYVRQLMGLSEEVKITKKFLRESMSMEQYEQAWQHYSAILKQQVEEDVPEFSSPNPPASENAEVGEGIAEEPPAEDVAPESQPEVKNGDYATDQQKQELRRLAQEVDRLRGNSAADEDVMRAFRHHTNGLRLPLYREMRNRLLEQQAVLSGEKLDL